MTDYELMQRALEALEADNSKLWVSEKRDGAITALRARLDKQSEMDDAVAQMEKQLRENQVELSRLYGCRDELQEATRAIDDPSVNNTRTLSEAILALRARLAQERPGLDPQSMSISWQNGYAAAKEEMDAEKRLAQPVAWMHESPERYDVIHAEVKALLQTAGEFHRPLDKTKHYTIPLYASPPPRQEQTYDGSSAAWFAVAMNAAASLEDAANCLRDPDAKRSALGAAEHVRKKCNEMWKALPRQGLSEEVRSLLTKHVPKLAELMRMPNAEWVADEHNAAVAALRAIERKARMP